MMTGKTLVQKDKLFDPRKGIHNTRGNVSTNLLKHHTRHKLRKNFFTQRLINQWNEMPLKFKEAKDVTFKILYDKLCNRWKKNFVKMHQNVSLKWTQHCNILTSTSQTKTKSPAVKPQQTTFWHQQVKQQQPNHNPSKHNKRTLHITNNCNMSNNNASNYIYNSNSNIHVKQKNIKLSLQQQQRA